MKRLSRTPAESPRGIPVDRTSTPTAPRARRGASGKGEGTLRPPALRSRSARPETAGQQLPPTQLPSPPQGGGRLTYAGLSGEADAGRWRRRCGSAAGAAPGPADAPPPGPGDPRKQSRAGMVLGQSVVRARRWQPAPAAAVAMLAGRG